MTKYNSLIVLITLLLLSSCTSNYSGTGTETSNGIVAVTVGYQVVSPTPSQIAPSTQSSRSRSTIDTVHSLTITSAQLVVNNIQLVGGDDNIMYADTAPYILNIAGADSTPVFLAAGLATVGSVYDSLILNIAADTIEDEEQALLNSESILIRGYTNNNPSEEFEFESDEEFQTAFPLAAPLIVSEDMPNRVRILLDVSQWFRQDDSTWYNPHDTLLEDAIEESILGGIYGDDDYDDDDDD